MGNSCDLPPRVWIAAAAQLILENTVVNPADVQQVREYLTKAHKEHNEQCPCGLTLELVAIREIASQCPEMERTASIEHYVASKRRKV